MLRSPRRLFIASSLLFSVLRLVGCGTDDNRIELTLLDQTLVQVHTSAGDRPAAENGSTCEWRRSEWMSSHHLWFGSDGVLRSAPGFNCWYFCQSQADEETEEWRGFVPFCKTLGYELSAVGDPSDGNYELRLEDPTYDLWEAVVADHELAYSVDCGHSICGDSDAFDNHVDALHIEAANTVSLGGSWDYTLESNYACEADGSCFSWENAECVEEDFSHSDPMSYYPEHYPPRGTGEINE